MKKIYNQTNSVLNQTSNTPFWFPTWMTNYAIVAFFAAMLIVILLFRDQSMELYNWILSTIGVLSFFYFSNKLSYNWKAYSVKLFEKNIFWITMLIRLIWILFFSQFTYWLWDTPWEQPEGTSMDSSGYYLTAEWYVSLWESGTLWSTLQRMAANSGVSDLGYPMYLAILSKLGLSSILWTRLPNCIFEAITCLMVYRIGRRHFGESVGRLSAIFVMLMPLTFMYAGITMKESMMIMIYMIAVNRLDMVIQGEKKGFWQVALAIGITALIAFFRTSLAAVTITAFLLGLVLSESKRAKWVNRLLILLLVISIGASIASPLIERQLYELQTVFDMTENNFENRSRGNILVKDFSTVMFAPLMFTVPFPTMVEIHGQTWQQLNSGGNYIKNILSPLIILLFVMLLYNRKWRPYTFIIAALCGNLIALALSSFAHSGRFHQPAVPLELLFVAAAMYLYPKQCKRIWKPVLFFEVIIIIGWNWFKLKGRGLI